nr:hypothetical protein CFP56_53203 [Quercus suber]
MKKFAVFVMVSFVLVSSLLTLSQGQQSVCSQQMVLEGTCDEINCGTSFPSSAQPRIVVTNVIAMTVDPFTKN